MLKNIIQNFLPWILYFLLKGHTREQLDIAIVVAAVTALIFELKPLRKGFILSWGTLFFFIFLLISVVIYKNEWILKNESLFSNGTLALIVWISILVRQPFTMQYAKEMVSPDKWKHPLFLRINNILSSVWGFIFLFNLALQVVQLYYPQMKYWLDDLLSYGTSIFGAWFTTWFPTWYKEKYTREHPFDE